MYQQSYYLLLKFGAANVWSKAASLALKITTQQLSQKEHTSCTDRNLTVRFLITFLKHSYRRRFQMWKTFTFSTVKKHTSSLNSVYSNCTFSYLHFNVYLRISISCVLVCNVICRDQQAKLHDWVDGLGGEIGVDCLCVDWQERRKSWT